MFAKLRRLFSRTPPHKPSPGMLAFREALGACLAEDALNAIEAVHFGDETSVYIEPTPGGFDAAFVHVIGPHGRKAFPISPGVPRRIIVEALKMCVEAVEATPEVIPFPADAPTPTPAG